MCLQSLWEPYWSPFWSEGGSISAPHTGSLKVFFGCYSDPCPYSATASVVMPQDEPGRLALRLQYPTAQYAKFVGATTPSNALVVKATRAPAGQIFRAVAKP